MKAVGLVRWGLLLAAGQGLLAQATDATERALQDILKMNTSVARPFQSAAMKPLTVRETPGIVSLLTREDIQALGARDLLEVLRTVPGLDFGVDNEGVVGLSMRGAWAHEGKVLLLLDGIEMVDGLFGNLWFGGHLPVEEIDAIEVIRGPGSAIYGGYAELGVISIRTRRGAQLDGPTASLTSGRMVNGKGRTNLSLAMGKAYGDFSYSASFFLGRAQRSDRIYTDVLGSAYSMDGQSDIRNSHLNLGLTYKGLSYRGVLEQHRLMERDHYVEALPYAVPIDFNTYGHRLQYERSLGEKGQVTAYLSHKRQRPWAVVGDETVGFIVNRYAERNVLGAIYSHDFSPTFNMLGGAEATRDHASADFMGLDPTVAPSSFTNQAAFAQGLWITEAGNLVLGARFDRHNQLGSSFSPRVAYTKAWTLMHVKLLAARAFRAPSLQPLELNRAIKPETTTTYEAEVGASLGPGLYATINLFDNLIRTPIIYANDGENDTYLNSGRMGSRGVEATLQWTGSLGSLNASYAWAQVKDSTVDLYAVPGHPNQALGIPPSKFTLTGLWRMAPQWTLSVNLVRLAPKHAFTALETETETGLTRLSGETLVDLNLRYAGGEDRISFGLGLSNVLDTAQRFAQPYRGDHAPLPGPSREVFLRVGYRM